MGCISQGERMLVKAEDFQKVKEDSPQQLRKLFGLKVPSKFKQIEKNNQCLPSWVGSRKITIE